MNPQTILLKKYVRQDVWWTTPLLYRIPWLQRIPLLLDIHALIRTQYWPRERIRALALARTRHMLKRAARLSFWQARLVDAQIDPAHVTFEDLARLPILTKQDFFLNEPGSYIDEARRSRSIHDYTSGSTGRPFDYYLDFACELRSFAICERLFITAGGGTRFPVVSLRGRWRVAFLSRLHTMFFIRTSTSVKYRVDDLVDFTKQFNGEFILYGYTSWLIELARCLSERGITLPVRAVIAVGEGISAEGRTALEQVFHCPFYLTYSSREGGWLGYECPEKRMHLSEEWAYVEIVDEEGTPVPDGTHGRIVVTTFDNDVMPFIRYDTGDRGTISADLCPCGRTLRTITFLGRTTEFIKVSDSRTVSLLDISPAFDRFYEAVRQYQIVHTGPLSFTMRIVAGARFETDRERLHDTLVRLMHPDVRITWELVDEIAPAASGKAAYYIDARSQAV